MLGPSNDPDPGPEFIWSDQMTFDFESGEFKPLEKSRFYRMVLRSVSEIGANVQIGNRLKIMSHEDYNKVYDLFIH